MRGRALVFAALVLGIWPAAAAAQQQDEGPAASLPVQTVPKIEGARFILNGRTFRTDANGRVTVPGDGQAGLQDRVEIPETTIAPGARVQFSRRKEGWYLFNRLVRVQLSFIDLQGRQIAASRVDRVTLKGVHGDRVTLKPGRPHWMQASRIVPFKEGFREKQLSWVVEEAIVEGQNVVNRNQQRFVPASASNFRITLLFYPAHVTVRDSFFGFPTGSRVNIKAPNGKVRHYRLGPEGEARVPSLPRGEYIVTVEGAGLSFEHPLTLSRKQLVDLEFLSYLDLAVGIGVVGSIAIGLLLLGGRIPRPSDVARSIRKLKLRPRKLRPSRPPSSESTEPGFNSPNPLDDDRWSGEFHLDFGHLATILRQDGGAYLGWDGDLSKALGTSSIIESLEVRSTLVVCRDQAQETEWAAELRRLLPYHEIKVLPSRKSQRDAMLAKAHVERRSTQPMVLVVHYEALAVVADRIRAGRSAQLGGRWRRLVEWDLVLADEAHRISDANSLMTRALKHLPSHRRLALSGSIFQKDAEELFPVLHWLFPEVPGVHDEAVVCRAKWRDSADNFHDLAIGVLPSQLETLRRDRGIFEVYRPKADISAHPPENGHVRAGELTPTHRNGKRL